MDRDNPVFNGRYDPVGHCIYCGAEGVHLSTEHIVPYALNGMLILPKASCETCARITGYKLEKDVLRSNFLNIRARLGLKTRNPKNRPRTFSVEIEHSDGRKEIKKIDMRYWPERACLLPIFSSLPRALTLAPFDPENLGFILKCHIPDDFNVGQFGGPGDKVTMTHGWIQFENFCRVLAKIAHSFAYALLGKDGFEPCLPPFILRKPDSFDDCTFFIGNDPESPPESNDTVVSLLLERKKILESKFEMRLCVRIRLFGYAESPSYIVVVGKRRGDKYFRAEHRGYRQPIKFSLAGGQ